MQINRGVLAFILAVFLGGNLVGCQSTPPKNMDPVQVLQKDGYVLKGLDYENQDIGVLLRTGDTTFEVSQHTGFNINTGFPNGLARGYLGVIIRDLYGSAVENWVIHNLPVAATNLRKDKNYGSCGDTKLKGSVSATTITIYMDGCFSDLTIYISPGLITPAPLSARDQEVLSILKSDGYAKSRSTSCMVDGPCSYLSNDTDTLISLFFNGSLSFTIRPGANTDIQTQTDHTYDVGLEAKTLAAALGKAYGPDLMNWFQKGCPNPNNTGHLTATISGYTVDLVTEPYNDSGTMGDSCVLTIGSSK